MAALIKPGQWFKREFKRLKRKYRSLPADVAGLVAELHQRPRLGEPLGNNCYKIRLAITSKARGKSGGARVITHVLVAVQPEDPTTVYLLAIYDKSVLATLSREEIDVLVAELGETGPE